MSVTGVLFETMRAAVDTLQHIYLQNTQSYNMLTIKHENNSSPVGSFTYLDPTPEILFTFNTLVCPLQKTE